METADKRALEAYVASQLTEQKQEIGQVMETIIIKAREVSGYAGPVEVKVNMDPVYHDEVEAVVVEFGIQILQPARGEVINVKEAKFRMILDEISKQVFDKPAEIA
jgi:hypothetical protein